MIGIVGGEQHGQALRRQALDLAEHNHLIAEVEAGGGLVHDDGRRVLGQGAGDEGELALAAADARVLVLRQRGDAERGQRLERLAPILARRRGEQPKVRRAAHHHHVEHAKRELRRVRLRHVGDATGDLQPAQLGHRPAVEQHIPGLRRQ